MKLQNPFRRTIRPEREDPKSLDDFKNDKKWEQLASWSDELGVPSWSSSVVCMRDIHPNLLMGSRYSAQKLMDGDVIKDQDGTEYKNSRTMRILCTASKKTCEYCNYGLRYHLFVIRDASHDNNQFLRVAVRAAAMLQKLLSKNNKVLVHCHSGRNRSALVILVYCALYTNWTYAQSLHKVRTYNTSRFSMQNTLANATFTREVRMNWEAIRSGEFSE